MSLNTMTEEALENIKTLLDGVEWGPADYKITPNAYTVKFKPRSRQKQIAWAPKMHGLVSRLGPVLQLLLDEARSHSDDDTYCLPDHEANDQHTIEEQTI